MKTTPQRIAYVVAASLLLGLVPLTASAQQRLEERLVRIERLLDSGALTDMANQQDQMRQTLQHLQGEVDLLRRDLDEIKRRQHDHYLDTDRRLRQLENTASKAVTPAAGDSDPASSEADGEATDYQAAFALLKSGQYAQAATAFERFLQRYPQGQYTANALYWLGESHYVVRDFAKALPHFQRVLDEHPASGKSPDALLKIGFIHHEQGNDAQARKVLEKVKADYPNTTAAALAEQRLLRISSSSR